MGGELTKIVVVGPGAMGCFLAGSLARAGAEAWLLDKNALRAREINAGGVMIEQGGATIACEVRTTADPAEPGTADLIIICVKAYDTASAARNARQIAGPETLILSLQNGVGNIETLVEIFGPDLVLGGTTTQGANLAGPGRVKHAGAGDTVIGEPGGGVRRAEAAAELLSRSGIETRTTIDLTALIWSKVVINAAINPLTAILGVRNGVLMESDSAKNIMREVVTEVETVCNSMGVGLLFENPFERACAVAEATALNISSMLADVRARRKTEVGQINGAIAGEARARGIQTPVNETLARLVRVMEETYEKKVQDNFP